MRVLVACEYSGIVRDAFRALGHDAVSCDLLPTERPGPHVIGDVAPVLGDGWDLLIGHPPCTYLASSGARWWKDPGDGRAPVCHRQPPGPDRWKNRSRTYTGIAAAMAAQWSIVLDTRPEPA